MKILFVCMQYIHSARWINQLKDSEHEIYVFDCLDKPIHEELLWTNTITNWSKRKKSYVKGEYFLRKKMPAIYEKIQPFLEVTPAEKLIEIISEIKPDLVHSLEMQSESYPVLKARKNIEFNWAYSCWGNDVFYYQDKKFHTKKIIKALGKIQYHFLECERDKKLITAINSHAEILGVNFPGGGGYDLKKYNSYKHPLNDRNLIIIKGYHHKFGRALRVLDALEQHIDLIADMDIYVYSAHEVVIARIKELNEKYGLTIGYSSRYNQISHEELLEKFGAARIAIGNNISDGVPNTLLEAIILGAFPIQSNPGGASEDFIENGVNGLLIDNPEDVNEIARLIKRALESGELLESATEKNNEIAKKLDYNLVKTNVQKAYSKIAAEL
ncbi:glycosyltransferase [Flavicella marina]|uniref:glycosyltransferase n=1 Tax=Flavicella marina TaxID=1475951 RepID=UPI0012641FD3|nr:glycosyltransferase [Flavicella marina]